MIRIKIFLASSITDLKLDRTEIGDFFGQLNEIYLDRGIHFSLIKCEYYDDTIALNGKQDQYDSEIRDSEIVFFLFYTKVGEYTKHEFDVALNNYRISCKPKIVTYFKYVNSVDEVTDEVKSFMNMLDKELKHFYNTYCNIDTLKLGMLIQIKLLKLDISEFDICDGKIRVNGNVVADSTNIPMFSGNKNLLRLRDQLNDLTKEYYASHAEYTNNPDDTALYKKFSKIALEKVELENEIYEIEKKMLSLAEKMTEDTLAGKLSERQKEAYRLLECGDYDGALAILNFNEIMNEVAHNELIANEINSRLAINVSELIQRIEVLKLRTITIEIADEIIKIYIEASNIVKKHNLDKYVLYEYADFLKDQNNYTDAIKVAEQLKYYYDNPEENTSEYIRAKVYNLLAILYSETQRTKEALVLHEMALKIRKRLSKEKPEIVYKDDLAVSYMNLGTLYSTMGETENAENMLKEAIAIYTILNKEKSELFGPSLAMGYNNLGALYIDIHRTSEAEKAFNNALKIYIHLNMLGILYYNTKQFKNALPFVDISFSIFKHLNARNPQKYIPELKGAQEYLHVLQELLK